jgi:ubiquinone/menaquinone biosynthesis C-methylase UbiE
MATALQKQYEAGPLRDMTGPAIRPGGTLLTGRAVRFCCFSPGDEILDVGCGAGATVEYLRGRHRLNAVGVDPSRRLLEEAWARNLDLPLGLGRAEAVPAVDATKDGIVCECVLSLLNDPALALAEFRRVLRPGGRLILSDLYERTAAGDNRKYGLLSRTRLEELLFANGFTLQLWEDHSRLLRELAAGLLMSHGTLEGFWRCADNSGCRAGERPGYYLLVARKD